MNKQYYVHALLYYWGFEKRLGPYRWLWLAKWRAHALMAEHSRDHKIPNSTTNSERLT